MSVPYLPKDIMNLILFKRRVSLAKDKYKLIRDKNFKRLNHILKEGQKVKNKNNRIPLTSCRAIWWVSQDHIDGAVWYLFHALKAVTLH